MDKAPLNQVVVWAIRLVILALIVGVVLWVLNA